MSLAAFGIRETKHVKRLKDELVSETDLIVLDMMADGCTQSEIAEEIGASINAVEQRLYKLYRRIGVKNAPAAVAWGFRNGYLK